MARRYEVIKSLGRNLLTLIQIGIVPIHILDRKTIYEEYLQYLENNSPAESKKIISAKYDIRLREAQRIVAFMEENTGVKEMT